SLEHRLDAPVRTVPHPARDAVPARELLRRPAERHALHATGEEDALAHHRPSVRSAFDAHAHARDAAPAAERLLGDSLHRALCLLHLARRRALLVVELELELADLGEELGQLL